MNRLYGSAQLGEFLKMNAVAIIAMCDLRCNGQSAIMVMHIWIYINHNPLRI